MSQEYHNFFVRVFIEPKDASEVEPIANHLRQKFEKYGIAEIESIKPYWKIETYVELSFLVEQCPEKGAFQQLMAEIGSNWNLHESDAVWNVDEGDLLSTSLRWAHIGTKLTPPIAFGTKVKITSDKPIAAHLRGEVGTIEGASQLENGRWNYAVYIESEQRVWCFDEDEITV